MRWLLVSLILILTACPGRPAVHPDDPPKPQPARDPERTQEPATAPEPRPAPPRPSFESRGWRTGPVETEIFDDPRTREQFCRRADGLKHGPYTRWHDTGRRAEEGEFRAGRMHGTWTRWDRQGRTLERGSYLDGIKHGEWFEFFEGRLAGEGPYRNGKKDGEWQHVSPHFILYVTWKDGKVIERLETTNDMGDDW